MRKTIAAAALAAAIFGAMFATHVPQASAMGWGAGDGDIWCQYCLKKWYGWDCPNTFYGHKMCVEVSPEDCQGWLPCSSWQ